MDGPLALGRVIWSCCKEIWGEILFKWVHILTLMQPMSHKINPIAISLKYL